MRNVLPLLLMVSQRSSGQRNLLTRLEAGKQSSWNQCHLILHTLTTLLPLLISSLTWKMVLMTLNTRILMLNLMYNLTHMFLLMYNLFCDFLVILLCPLSLSLLLAR